MSKVSKVSGRMEAEMSKVSKPAGKQEAGTSKVSKLSGGKRLVWIGLFFCIHTELMMAQAWSKADSAWLANMLAGKDTIRLNPEFQKAIQSGNLINLGEPIGKMQMAPIRIPLAKDFSEYINDKENSSGSDSSRRRVALKDLPPSVFMRYGLDKPLPFNGIYQQAYTPYRRPAGRPATGISLSFDNALQAAFSPSYRQKMHNRKHATAWKTYNDLPTPDIHRKQKKFRADHPELVLQPDTARQPQQTSKRDTVGERKQDATLKPDTAQVSKSVALFKRENPLNPDTIPASRSDTVPTFKPDTVPTFKPDTMPALKRTIRIQSGN